MKKLILFNFFCQFQKPFFLFNSIKLKPLIYQVIFVPFNSEKENIFIAGSIGPYPDCPASEYNPEYLKRMSLKELIDWHRPRFELLANSSVDLLAIETIPGKIIKNQFLNTHIKLSLKVAIKTEYQYFSNVIVTVVKCLCVSNVIVSALKY